MIRDGIAILAAILAAFALDAWWTDRDEARRTDELLAAMTDEFVAAAVQLDSIATVNERALLHLSGFLERVEPSLGPIPSDSLEFFVAQRDELFQVYDPAFGALTTLLSVGGLERVRDPEVQRALGGWYGELDDMTFEERQIEVATQQFFLALASVSAVPYGTDHGRLMLLARSEAYRQAHALLWLTLDDYQRDLVRLRNRASEVSRLLGR